MITAESLFFAILGTTRAEITPSVLATEITAELLFDENLGFDDFRITKDVYPTVAKLLRRSSDSVSRSVERMTAPISALRYGTDVPPNRDQRVMIASRSAPTET